MCFYSGESAGETKDSLEALIKEEKDVSNESMESVKGKTIIKNYHTHAIEMFTFLRRMIEAPSDLRDDVMGAFFLRDGVIPDFFSVMA